jgi:hypothetical protein
MWQMFERKAEIGSWKVSPNGKKRKEMDELIVLEWIQTTKKNSTKFSAKTKNGRADVPTPSSNFLDDLHDILNTMLVRAKHSTIHFSCCSCPFP